MAIDPLLPERRPVRRHQAGWREDAAAQLLAVSMLIGGVFLAVGAAELSARGADRLFGDAEAGVGVGELGQHESGADLTVRDLVLEGLPNGAGESPARGVEPAGKGSTKRYAPRYCDWMIPIMERHDLPLWMTAVAHRESRCQAGVHNGDRSTGDDSYGLFQINTLGDLWDEVQGRCGVQAKKSLLEPETNIKCASALYRAYGYKPWDSGKYFD